MGLYLQARSRQTKMICENERSTRNHVCTITIKIENKSDAKKEEFLRGCSWGFHLASASDTKRILCFVLVTW